MIGAELLAILRCPMDPSHTVLTLEETDSTGQPQQSPDRLVCTRCRVVFPVKDGFPTLLIEEAQLPPNCTSVDQLPCQREAKR
jgi:uncharacterized protein YbaR (Trm112 family)